MLSFVTLKLKFSMASTAEATFVLTFNLCWVTVYNAGSLLLHYNAAVGSLMQYTTLQMR